MSGVGKLLVGLGIIAAAFAMNARVAHADPDDVVGVQARIVCAALDASPTVATFDQQVSRLSDRYTPDSEQQVMYAAMHWVCPEYQPIATAWIRAQQQPADGIIHQQVI